MRRLGSDYAAAAVFLFLFTIGGFVTTLLPSSESAALEKWASTNVTNLQHHPVPALVLSAFLPAGSPLAWLAPIALTMFGANRAVGTARLALICAAGHLIGTAVSEGIVAYRIGHGSLPQGLVAPPRCRSVLRRRLRDRRRGPVRDPADPAHGPGGLCSPGIRQPHLCGPD